MSPVSSPYAILGVPPTATDAQVRAAYRRLVQLHHPDHNQNSAESTRRFEEVQEAYAQVARERKSAPRAATPPDPNLDSRLQDLERQVQAAQAARERARRAALEAAQQAARKAAQEAARKAAREDARKAAEQAARKAAQEDARKAAAPDRDRPSDEELGYVTTEDSFTKILADGFDELAAKLDRHFKR